MAFIDHMFEDVFNIVAALSIVSGLALSACGSLYLALLLGPKWNAIREPLAILAVFGALYSIEYVFPSAFRAAGRPDVLWKFNLVRFVAVALLVLLGIRYGINGVSVVQVLAMVVIIPANAIILARVVAFPSRRLLSVFLPHAAGAAMAVLIVAISRLMPALRAVGADPRGAWAIALAAVAAYGMVLAALSPASAALARTAVASAMNARHRFA